MDMGSGNDGDDEMVIHLCEWYEHGERFVGVYETLGDGSGFVVTGGLGRKAVNHQLTRPDGTPLPGIERLRFHDLDTRNAVCVRDGEAAREKERVERIEHERMDRELRALGVLDDGESLFE